MLLSKFYEKQIIRLFSFYIPKNKTILQVGARSTHLVKQLKPKSASVVLTSKIKEPKVVEDNITIYRDTPEKLNIKGKFDFIIISDFIGCFEDIQKVLENLRQNCTTDTRITISYYNYLWEPLLKFGEKIGLKRKQQLTSWLSVKDMENLVELAQFELIEHTQRILIPFYIPLITHFANKYLIHLPLISKLALVKGFVARPLFIEKQTEKSVAVVVPARNEAGNIEPIVKNLPDLGKGTEIIFVEGGSSDNTWDEIKRVKKAYPKKNISYYRQPGKGKGDAVWLGFEKAKSDILMIYDADRTVPETDLYKFYNAIVTNKAEFAFGSRLVYPMEKEAMRFLNILGNKFFSMAFSWILNRTIKDTLCGTKVMTKENYEKLKKNRSYFGDFDPFGDFDLIFGSAKLNLKMVEIPIRYKARSYGETNISRFRHGLILLRMVFFSLKKIKFIK